MAPPPPRLLNPSFLTDILLIAFITSCCSFCLSNANAGFMKGKTITCRNEGELVEIPAISDNPCITCRCQNGVVACDKKSCSLSSSCHFATPGNESACCDVCKDCHWRGTRRANDEVWTDPDDPCQVYACQSGVLTRTKIECHVQCGEKKASPPLPGQCCPSCPSPSCQAIADALGQRDNVPRSYTIPVSEKETTDPCVQCQCLNGFSTCWKRACPVLPCAETRVYHRRGECCPQCQRGFRRVRDVPGVCYLRKLELRNDGRSHYEDDCTDCVCKNTTVSCFRKTCPSLSCPPEHRTKEEGECCSRCRDHQEQKRVCNVRGKIYKEGESWWAANCTKCSCHNNKIHCEAVDCSRLNPCPPGFQEKLLPGECCRTCVEADAVCSVFGDSGYKTFDGAVFGFRSLPCRYLLARDCNGSNFSISIVNDLKHGTTKTRSVVLKVENTKVQLGNNFRVKVGRKRVKLPHVILSVLSIRSENNQIVVRTNNGIKLLWDEENYLEVHLATTFKKKVCGLCGNYDNDPKNDQMTKKGQQASSIASLAQSWMSGKKAECKSKTPVTVKELNDCDRRWDMKWDSRRRARVDCNRLSDPPLAACHSNIDSAPYIVACMTEHCDCQSRPKTCHCQVLKAYVSECQRMGVSLSNWRNATNCQGGGGRCPAGSTFTPCGASCRKTCKDIQQRRNRAVNCQDKCQAGCECEKGAVWHRHRCVAPQFCPRT